MIEFFVSSASYSNVCTNVENFLLNKKTKQQRPRAYNEINIAAKKKHILRYVFNLYFVEFFFHSHLVYYLN